MPGEATLIVTTRSGVRPLGVRGEPLHNAAPQLRRVVRRRLGDETADLLADPQPHENDRGIDWYAVWSGPVRRVTDLPPAERDAVLAGVERRLAEIRRLGDMLAGHGPKEETGVVGLSLKLAARAPSPDFVFLVGDRPVIVAWGYETEAASALLPLTLPRVPDARVPDAAVRERRPVLDAAQRAPVSTPPAVIPAAGIPWWRTLAAALPLLLLLLAGAWALRGLLPVPPDVAIATREGPDAPPAPEAPPDPLPALKASYAVGQSRERALKVELALAEAELKRRIADCKPPEPPKPPQVAVAPPPPAPAPPKVAPPAPAPQPRNPADNRLRLPNAPTNDYSFMQGCWRTDPTVTRRCNCSPASPHTASMRAARASSNGGAVAPPAARAPRRASRARCCGCATPIRPATTVRAGSPTSSSASAAPTTWRSAAASRATPTAHRCAGR